mmetsp:Transcript_41275/g.99441  ORF Transcript_41275/g.99441 Transcript_41275/m.99441 type:complete len:93 (-) Transcript_41275:1319-1597(-)
MATSWYRPGVVPKIVKSWKVDSTFGLFLELWDSTCIVTNFREAKCPTLINPANPSLSGVSKFPYFPKVRQSLPLNPLENVFEPHQHVYAGWS